MKKYMKKMQAIYQYGDTYKEYFVELSKLFQYYNENKKKVAIWGAGLKGMAFLSTIDTQGQLISFVVDSNVALQDTSITKKHRVSSLERTLEGNPDVFLIVNAAHYADNYGRLRERGFEGPILDLDYLVENQVPFEAILDNSTELSYEETYDYRLIHKGLLEILLEINRICKNHNINYFLSAGTALGAIRHKGFIPWDDDADIGMLRKDFERFREIVKDELSHEYYHQQMEPKGFYRGFDQVGKKRSAFVSGLTKDLKIRHGLHIDIFPFDKVPEDENQRIIHWKEVQTLRDLVFKKLVPNGVYTKNIYKRFIINHEYYSMKLVSFKFLNSRFPKELTRYNESDSKLISDLLTHYKKQMVFHETDIFPVAMVEFEGYEFPVPRNCEIYLETMYGDYMTPPPIGKRTQRKPMVMLSHDKPYHKDLLYFKE